MNGFNDEWGETKLLPVELEEHNKNRCSNITVKW